MLHHRTSYGRERLNAVDAISLKNTCSLQRGSGRIACQSDGDVVVRCVIGGGGSTIEDGGYIVGDEFTELGGGVTLAVILDELVVVSGGASTVDSSLPVSR